MYNETYDEYIRSILGYRPNNLYDTDDNQNMYYETMENRELENYYPEIYKIVYPMIKTKCSNCRGNISRDDLENMTDEIYFAIEQNDVNDINININNSNTTNQFQRETRGNIKRPEEKIIKEANEKRETRQINRGLRDLIKILLIRELLGIPGRRPPMPPPPPRPPYGPGPIRPPFNRDNF